MAPLEIQDNLPRKMSNFSEGYVSDEGSFTETFESCSHEQIFVNKNLNLSKISCYGFDMDYTLCEYISPQFDKLACDLAKKWLVDSLNYPEDILDIEYDPSFGVRGLWFDRITGNLIKTDQFGKILQCSHGFRMMKDDEIKNVYPGKIQRKDESRVFVMNTMFNIAETFLVSALINYLNTKANEDDDKVILMPGGWRLQGRNVTFGDLFKDLRAAIDDIHIGSLALKKTCLSDLPRFVKKDPRLPAMLKRIRRSGRKTFLVTNSDWWYTSQIMEFLLGDSGADQDSWMSYFDLVLVDARKPKFFSIGSEMRMVENIKDRSVGSKTVLVSEAGDRTGPTVYSGGDHSTLTKILGAKGPDVMYAGDHLFADVIKCRKLCDWKTVLIVPELEHELSVSIKQFEALDQLSKLETLLGRGCHQLEQLKITIWDKVNSLNKGFSATGSLFRSGSRLSYFGSQVLIWSDVYTGSVNNLLGYPLDHRFMSPSIRMPHERRDDDGAQNSGRNSSEAGEGVNFSLRSYSEEDLPQLIEDEEVDIEKICDLNKTSEFVRDIVVNSP